MALKAFKAMSSLSKQVLRKATIPDSGTVVTCRTHWLGLSWRLYVQRYRTCAASFVRDLQGCQLVGMPEESATDHSPSQMVPIVPSRLLNQSETLQVVSSRTLEYNNSGPWRESVELGGYRGLARSLRAARSIRAGSAEQV